MANKKVIIIGAGMTGLCAGSYLQMNGYDTEIFELDNGEKHSADIVVSAADGFDTIYNMRENDRAKYKEEKQKIADRLIQELEKKIGNIKDKVEVIDVATPATFNRYTNNWRGSYEGWLPGPGALMVTIKKELPGLNNLYMIGQWVEPGGGLPNTIRSGRYVAQIICKKDNKEFEVKK